MSSKRPRSLEKILKTLMTDHLTPEECLSLIIKFEDKIKADIDLLFEKLAGAHIHEIQSKIGFAKNVLNLVLESKGAFDYAKALDSAITQLEDILALYHRSGISTELK